MLSSLFFLLNIIYLKIITNFKAITNKMSKISIYAGDIIADYFPLSLVPRWPGTAICCKFSMLCVVTQVI
jgi:hypothetical protein